MSTEQQQKLDDLIVDVVRDWYRYFRQSPTVRELVEVCDVNSTSTVHAALDRLVRAGRVRRGNGKARALCVVEGE